MGQTLSFSDRKYLTHIEEQDMFTMVPQAVGGVKCLTDVENRDRRTMVHNNDDTRSE